MYDCPRSRLFAVQHGNWQAWLAAAVCMWPSLVHAQAPLPGVVAPETLPEIIVTARRVTEDLRSVPISVQVIPGDLLDTLDLSRLYELQFNVPGLVVNNQGLFGAGFSLRGVGGQRGGGQYVAAHMDGVYLGDANLAINRMFDLERIEVLKGPQGTLYGRNSTAGAINFITRSAEHEFSAAVEGAYGSFSTTRAQGHVNLPLRDSAALRLAFIASEGDGYIRNSVDDRRFAEEDFWGLRGSLRIDVSDDLGVAIMAQRVRDDGASGELWTPNPAFLPDPGNIRLTTVTLADPFLIVVNDIARLTLDYELSFATFHVLTGYARTEVDNRDDCAGVPILQGCVRGSSPLKHRQYSQELQLRSRGQTALEWLLGAYYFDSDQSINFFTTTAMAGARPVVDYRATSSETAKALFAHFELPIAERWRISGGVRLSSEDQRVTTVGTGIRDSPSLLAGESSSDDASWRVDLAYSATDALTTFASVSTGYQSGGFTSELRNGQLDDYDPEKLIAYEVGAKSRWLGGRLELNTAAFLYDVKDMQVRTVRVTEGRPALEVDNAAKAEIYGIDAEGGLRASERWTISAGAVWLPKREFVDYRNDETGDTLSGNKLSRAPEWSYALALVYDYPVSHLGWLSARLEYNYRSFFYYTKENESIYAQDGFGLVNLYLRFDSRDGRWYAFASGRNLTREDYFNQVFLQSSPGYPDTYEVGGGYRF
jgi:iron complex outermembrane recepter protein